MSIDFFQASDGIHVRQSLESPSIYLDHWALRLFSDEKPLQNRLISILKAKEGTLLFSAASLTEFCKLDDLRHAKDAEVLLERIMPNVFFTNLYIDEIHDRELIEEDNKKRFWPPADLATLKYLAESNYSSKGHFIMEGFLSMSNQRRSEMRRLQAEVVESVKEAYNTNRSQSAYVSGAKHAQLSDNRTRTHKIYGELLRGFNLDVSSPITNNDVVDLFHAVAPINCCDFVLLDGPWEERVKKMNIRISKAAVVMPIAQCFSKRNNGIERFLTELELFDKGGYHHEAIMP